MPDLLQKPMPLLRLVSILPVLLALWIANPAAAFDIAIGDEEGPTYGLGIGISSLVKVKLLPVDGTDLNPLITLDDQESLQALRSGSIAFALVSLDGSQSIADPGIQAVATLGRTEAGATTLLARSDVDGTAVERILDAIFSNTGFLTAIEPEMRTLDPDKAVMGLTLPLHDGAKRFYAGWWASPDRGETAVATAPAPAPTIQPTAATAAAVVDDRETPAPSPTVTAGVDDARNYVLYFGFDDDSLNDDALATLRDAASFAGGLRAPAISVAGYTDSAGDAEYNFQLAQRRAQAVMEGIESLGVRYSRMDLSLYGERSPWSVTLDGISEASNRRVELFIEEPVPEVQPLPIAGGGETIPASGSQPASPSERILTPAAQPAGGPEHRIVPSGKTRRLM